MCDTSPEELEGLEVPAVKGTGRVEGWDMANRE